MIIELQSTEFYKPRSGKIIKGKAIGRGPVITLGTGRVLHWAFLPNPNCIWHSCPVQIVFGY